ncbi:MAG: DUF2829 domain-containing protein [Treponema sp.]|jgi:hypothetical protein|nr:DUF2829 domain-containing protein [Treponema sp.]
MQKYIGVKIVQAEPESKDGKEGFKVRYEEGYESWCPKDVFLKHNRPTEAMPFSFAIEAAKQGKKITRKGWNGKNQYVFLIPDYVFKREEIPALKDDPREEVTFWGCFCIMTSIGKVQMGWLATQSDMQAADWEIVA